MFSSKNTKFYKFLFWFLVILSILPILFTVGCSNNKPTISQLTATPSKLAYGETSTIIVKASDEDNDNLSFSWSCTDGSIANQQNSSSTSSITWTAPQEVGVYEIVVTINDGEDEIKESINIEIMGLFYEGFTTDLGKWSNSYCSSWLASGVGHVSGNSSGFYGTMYHEFNQYVVPEYTLNMKAGRVSNFNSDEYYGLYTQVNDDVGAFSVSYWWFIIEPSASGENWAIICFFYSPSSWGWVLLASNSYGNSPLISTNSNELNNITWTIEQDKTVIVKVGSQILYQTDEISNIESLSGEIINMDLVSVGARTFYNKEIKLDDVIVKTPTNALPKIVKKVNSNSIQSLENRKDLKSIPKDFSKLKTLKEFLTEIKQ